MLHLNGDNCLNHLLSHLLNYLHIYPHQHELIYLTHLLYFKSYILIKINFLLKTNCQYTNFHLTKFIFHILIFFHFFIRLNKQHHYLTKWQAILEFYLFPMFKKIVLTFLHFKIRVLEYLVGL